jgi:hypothetical protein
MIRDFSLEILFAGEGIHKKYFGMEVGPILGVKKTRQISIREKNLMMLN